MKLWLLGKEFIIYDTFDNPLFLVKQIAKFKSEFMKSIPLMQQ